MGFLNANHLWSHVNVLSLGFFFDGAMKAVGHPVKQTEQIEKQYFNEKPWFTTDHTGDNVDNVKLTMKGVTTETLVVFVFQRAKRDNCLEHMEWVRVLVAQLLKFLHTAK